ncbi:MAG: branched-chain amino acid ABC transporter permease [Desulfobacteraceae bacterium]|jgi:branched-chain amino acid transport system permease protein
MEKIIEIIFNGLATGAIYALIALGFVLIFKSTGILNFAQGELCMVGAFICYHFATLHNVPYLLSFLIAIALGILLGMLIDILFFRRLVGQPIYSTIMVTLGLASILTCLAGLTWGHQYYSIHSPFTEKTLTISGIIFSHAALYTIGFSILLLILFMFFFNRSLLGVAMRGTAEDSDAAGLMGINVKKIHMVAWAIGSLVAVVAGIFLAEKSFVHTGMSHTGIKAMSAAILGGMESLGGAILSGFIIGIVEGLAASYLSGLELGNFHFGDIKDVTAFAIMILVLMIRPHGIFGKEEVERV